jgi:glyoxylase-like metal-dependent hydrolase (beta-lactamase superfamily II)
MKLQPRDAAAGAPERVAEGVYLIRHEGEIGNGNTVVVIGQREVLVVDSCFLPAVARQDIAQIRTLTDKPVRYLLNTHWHNDHNAGNAAYMEAFPGLAIIAHAETRTDMDLYVKTYPERLRAGIVLRQQRQDAGKDEDGKPFSAAARATASADLAQRQQLAKHYQEFVYQAPTLTFRGELELELGDRAVQIRHLGRGNTSGDAIAFLPKGKVVVTGDLLVHPVPYVYDGYPSEWIATLDEIARLGATTLVPGHGEILRDTAYLQTVRELLQSAVDQLQARLRVLGPAEFLALEAVRGSIDLAPFRQRFAGDDPARGAAFDAMAERLVKLVFTEATLR